MMIEPNMKLLEAMRDEANLCYERGDEADGNALVESIFAQIFPGLVEAAKNDPKIIYQLIIQGITISLISSLVTKISFITHGF